MTGGKVEVRILTANRYLAHALQSLIGGSPELSGMLSTKAAADTTGPRLALVDVDGIVAGKAEWPRISEGMAASDVCVFMSLRGMRVRGLPWLSVDTPVAVLKRALASTVRYGLGRREGLSRSALLAPLSQSEREVFLFLLCGYELTEIYEAVGVSRKSVYAIKSKILRRLGLESTRELCAVMRLCEFAEFHEQGVYRRADRAVRAAGTGEYASLTGRTIIPGRSESSMAVIDNLI